MSAAATHTPSTLPVVICDRRRFDRAALRALCGHDPGLVVVGEAATGDDALRLLPATGPAVLLIGRSPVREDPALLRRVHAGHPALRIVIVGLSGELAPGAAADAGADGFLARDGDLADQLAVLYG
jgi:DNA-binding NarL/FixJ family response regulator